MNVDSAVSAVAEVETSEQNARGVLFGTTLKAEMGLNFVTNFIAPQVPSSWLSFWKEFNCV